MAKKAAKTKRKSSPKIKEVVLPHDEVVRIIAPPGAVPVVAIVAENIIEIAPAKKKSWWDVIFGN